MNEPLQALRDAIASVGAHCGELHRRYDEDEAIALVRVLGKCLRTIAIAPIGATPTQQELRLQICETCLRLERAMWRAIGSPQVQQHQTTVVDAVVMLLPLIHSAKQAFEAGGE